MTAGNKGNILADSRWAGDHGIGRFTTEVLERLNGITIQSQGPKPLSLYNLLWQPYYLWKHRRQWTLYFNPGFNALPFSPIPFIFVIHDLNHLHFPDQNNLLKKIYYKILIKFTAQRAALILTPSEYSKQSILDWTKLPENKIKVVSSGVSEIYSPHGIKHQPGYPYLFNIGNTKPHKNVARLLIAFSCAQIPQEIKLILTGEKTPELLRIITDNKLEDRVVFSGKLSEATLSEYYRGAIGIVFPSLYEGFGLPVVEAMASGVPLLTSNVTSLPEIAGDAAIIIDPYDVPAIAHGITELVTNTSLRHELIQKGIERTKRYTWDRTAALVQAAIDEVVNRNRYRL